MSVSRIEPGDWVVYVEDQSVFWGPWEVVSICGEVVTVRLDATLTHNIPADQLRKLGSASKPPNFS